MVQLILLIVIGLPLYVAFCLVKPDKACRRCGGWGSKPGRRPASARRQCARCDSTGRRFRAGARVVYRLRGAQRRHAWLTERAAQRTEDGL